MTVTCNSDCSTLTFSSEYLEEAAGKTIDSIKLRSRLNCSSAESTLDLSSLIPDVLNGSFNLSAEIFYNDETKTIFCDGVYYLALDIEYTVDSDSFLAKESNCKFVGCNINCKLQDYFEKTRDSKPFFYHYALTQANACDACYCTQMCVYYDELKHILNDYGNTASTSGCGCS